MRFTEKSLVEDYIVQKLIDKGWKFASADELERDSFEEPLLVPNLVRTIKRINEDIGEDEVRQVLTTLKLTGTGVEGAKRILSYYRFGVPVKLAREKTVRYVKLFDFENLEDNEFIVSRQVTFKGRATRRLDIVLYVNGIPLVNIECKNPVDISESWENAYRQIKDYEKDIPELYKYVQIGVAAESEAKYFPIVPWQEKVTVYEWRENGKDSIDSTIEMLSQYTLLDLIRNFLFYRIERGNATKVLARYMQYRAANQIVERVIRNLQGIEWKRKGLIWHWQGSGKTLTMVFAANKLQYAEELENPTILFIVDRIELQEQLYSEMAALDISKPEIIETITQLKNFLQHDNYRGKRGYFILLIHKFRPEELKELEEELEELSKKQETIMNRRNVIAFVDEGHRTQYGVLAAQMKNILRSAFFFAFTGTPISKRGRDTFLEFSNPPEELYIDKYFIADSIKDGFTVKIAYQPRLEKDVHLKRELLEAFLEAEFEELPEEIREEIEKGVKKKLTTIKLILENEKRIGKIAEDLAQHFEENVDGKFKAIVIAASRKACVIYKQKLDEHIPEKYSEVVMTFTHNDSEPIRSYGEKLKEKYGYGKEFDEIRKEIIEKFREEEFPKILIVTDMLLTGFDAPILQTMYLDKPLKEHRLLQAIARTNRPYKDLKEYGLIIDYVGILKEIEKAFEIYSKEDITGTLYDLKSVAKEFTKLIDETLTLFESVPRDWSRESLLEAIEVVTTDSLKERTFTKNYKRIRKLFEILGPHHVKLEKFETYKWLTSIYNYYLKNVLHKERDPYVERYFEKTLKYVHKSTELESLEKELPTIVFDDNYLKNLERVKSKREKAANILFMLNRLVLIERYRSPIHESLVDRVERLIKEWREKTKDYEKIYKEGVQIVQEIQKLTERQKTLELTDLEYSILLTLEKWFGDADGTLKDARELSERLKQHMFPGWAAQLTARRRVEAELRRFVRRYVRKGLSMEQINKLYDELLKDVKTYGVQ